MLDDRKLAVLRAIVTDYVASREPVGSKALVERYHLDVSSATVRNDMAVLEEEGYLTQPHTSAGRIPTDKGYRLFVDRLVELKPLSPVARRAIVTFLQGAPDLDDVVSRTVRLLAQITHQVAIVQYPISSSTTVRHIELVSLGIDRVLVILIRSTGHVEQRTLDLPNHTEETLARLRDLLNRAAVGLSQEAAIEMLTRLPDAVDPNACAEIVPVTCALVDLLATGRARRVVVGGVPNLARFGEDFSTTVKPVLEALEEQVVLLHLLGEAASLNPGDLSVRIGQENPYEPLRSTSLVATSYGTGDDLWASLGVVGPTRMDYPTTMAAVRAVARYLGRFLAEG